MESRKLPQIARLPAGSPLGDLMGRYARVFTFLALTLTVPFAGLFGLVGIGSVVVSAAESTDDDDVQTERVDRDSITCELRNRISQSRKDRLSHPYVPQKRTTVHHAALMVLDRSVNVPPLHSPLRC